MGVGLVAHLRALRKRSHGMTVLFLDVDGVLNHNDCPDWADGTPWVVDPACVQRVRDICYLSDARVVLSSSWRHSEDGCAYLATLGIYWDGAHTPLHLRTRPRRSEIQEYLDAHTDVTRYAVLDDEPDADLGNGSFFRTDFMRGGLTAAIARQVSDYLCQRN
jgi:hypothetical protein